MKKPTERNNPIEWREEKEKSYDVEYIIFLLFHRKKNFSKFLPGNIEDTCRNIAHESFYPQSNKIFPL